jgi:Raf kinase inhibitor-like YbhB/YbcL family protein
MALRLTSTSFADGQPIPPRHTCEGEDLSPPLVWAGAPDNTAGYALLMEDPDAPAGTWVHWVLYGIPADARHLPEGLAKTRQLGGGMRQGACWGVHRFERTGYHGPCPPPGRPHRYVFELLALAEMPPQPAGLTAAELREVVDGQVLEKARLVGTYRRG